MPITVIGSLNQDLVTYTNRVPNGGETVKGETFEHHLGGKGFNEVIALTRLKAPADDVDIKLWGKVGDDGAGDQFLAALDKEHVNTTQIRRINHCVTGTAVIIVEKPTGENRIVIVPGANGHLHPSDSELDTYFSHNDKRHFVVLQNEFENSTTVIHRLKTFANVSTVYNPSPLFVFDKDLLQALRESNFVIVNEHEALQIADNYQSDLHDVQLLHEDSAVEPVPSIAKFVGDYVSVLAKLSNLLPTSTIVITMGANGVLYRPQMSLSYSFLPSNDIPKKDIVDTTGCGDTFLGAFTLCMYKGETIGSAIQFANNAAGTAAMSKGAADSIPQWIDIQNKYYNNK